MKHENDRSLPKINVIYVYLKSGYTNLFSFLFECFSKYIYIYIESWYIYIDTCKDNMQFLISQSCCKDTEILIKSSPLEKQIYHHGHHPLLVNCQDLQQILLYP